MRDIAPHIEIVTTPTFDWVAEQARECQSKMLVGSPYITNALVELSQMAPKRTIRRIVTRTNLRDFSIGFSSLDALCALAESGARVFSLNNLHAKIYIFDEKTALVTSANATRSGMQRNWECGFALNHPPTAKRLSMMLLGGLGADDPPERITLQELQELRSPSETIEVTLADADSEPESEPMMVVSDIDALLASFKGWKEIVLRGAIAQGAGEFRLQAMYDYCERHASDEYADNQNPEPKVRQTLQFLRDHGLIEFLGGGRYRLSDSIEEARAAATEPAEPAAGPWDQFEGCLQIVLRAAYELGSPEFELAELRKVCVPRIVRAYPNNRRPDAKLRQQLQFLRDLGQIEFLERGRYRLIGRR